jgi:hypothetical protein
MRIATWGVSLSLSGQDAKCYLPVFDEALALGDAADTKEKLSKRPLFGDLLHRYGVGLVRAKEYDSGIRVLTRHCLYFGGGEHVGTKAVAFDALHHLGYAFVGNR